MASSEEDLATLWSRMCGNGKVDPSADNALQLDTALLQLHSQLSCGSQSGQTEGGNNLMPMNLSSISSLPDVNPPRRTNSLPAPGPANYFGSNQMPNQNALQALQLSQYYSRMGASPPHATSVNHQTVPSPGMPPLAPGSSKMSPHNSHISSLHSVSSNTSQQIQQAQNAFANSIKRSNLGIATLEDEQTANSYLQLARLLRHHSAPSSVLGGTWNGNVSTPHSLLGSNQDGFLNAMFNDHLTTMSGITSDSDGTQADSGTIGSPFDQLSRSQLMQEDNARSALLRRADSLLQDQYSISEVMQLGNLELTSPSRILARQDGSIGSAGDFNLGAYSTKEDDSRKRNNFDLISDRDFMRKRCKSPDQDYESPVGHANQVSHMSNHHSQHSSGQSHHSEELLPENSVLCKARAKRGCATHPRSIAERVRRTRISENMKKLQELVPNIDKQANTADMLDEAVEYMKYLKHQVQILTEARAAQQPADEVDQKPSTRSETVETSVPSS